MKSDRYFELYKQHHLNENKYTYFLLAVSASAIALSIKLTSSRILDYSLIPLGLAVLCWAISFFCGCRRVQYVSSTIFANMDYLRVLDGSHPDVPQHPDYISAASEGIAKAMQSNSERASSHSRNQFRFIVYGGMLFLLWHITEMIVRTFT